MKKFTFINFNQSISFARSDEGSAYILSQYVGRTCYVTQDEYTSIYRTPVAAALGALASHTDVEIKECGNRYSVYVVRCDGISFYCADIGYNDEMTHTDREGFIYFLQDRDWTDPDWIRDIFDLEIDIEGCLPYDLIFNLENPWTLHEARAIARFGDILLTEPATYPATYFPKVIALDNREALLIIFNGAKVEWYGVLSEDSVYTLRENANRYHFTDFDYAIELCAGRKLCYYDSDPKQHWKTIS